MTTRRDTASAPTKAVPRLAVATRLMAGEMRRILSRSRYWYAVLGSLVYPISYLVAHRDASGGQLPWWYVCQVGLTPVEFMLPLIATVSVGMSLQEDRSTSFVALIRSRGVSKGMYVFTKLAAASAMLLSAILIIAAAASLAAFALLPHQGTAFPGSPPGILRSDLGFAVTLAMKTMSAATFYLLIASVVSMLTVNVFAVLALPLAVEVVPTLTLPANLDVVNPLHAVQVGLGPSQLGLGPSQLAGVGAWLAGVGLMAAFCAALARWGPEW